MVDPREGNSPVLAALTEAKQEGAVLLFLEQSLLLPFAHKPHDVPAHKNKSNSPLYCHTDVYGSFIYLRKAEDRFLEILRNYLKEKQLKKRILKMLVCIRFTKMTTLCHSTKLNNSLCTTAPLW